MSERLPESRRQSLQRSESRVGRASLILLGLIAGVSLALYYAWIVEPVVYEEVSPARLSEEYRGQYIYLVSQSYAADGDLNLAEDRLDALDEPHIAEVVTELLEGYLRQGEPASIMANMANLAHELGAESPAIALFVAEGDSAGSGGLAAPPPAAQAVAATVNPTRAASPTRPTSVESAPADTPSAVPNFRLINQEPICLINREMERIEVIVLDAQLEPLPGIEVIVRWADGSDHFYTGFKPEYGLGYADFQMAPDQVYDLVLAEGSMTVEGLNITVCDDAQGGHAGGWRLTFQNSNVSQVDMTFQP